MMRLLLLGGSTEANRLASRLSRHAQIKATLSLAGRTTNPAAATLPTRRGGFGGIEGLSRYLMEERIDVVVDATHPFAAQMSRNAAAACAIARIPLALFTRPPWKDQSGDTWIEVSDSMEAAAALGPSLKRVFLAVGRQQLAAFRDLPHHFLVRTIDPPSLETLPRFAEILLAKGPFSVAEEIDLMRRHAIDILVSKNSGGGATVAKIEAARSLGLPVVMIQRPPVHGQTAFYDVEEALAWIESHRASP
jgi:precorrin-6A/cobalt-precorrin-6A reductase